MKIYDISQEVFGCTVYPGDTAPCKQEELRMARGDLIVNRYLCDIRKKERRNARVIFDSSIDRPALGRLCGPANGNRSKQASQKPEESGCINIVEFGGILDWPGEIEK